MNHVDIFIKGADPKKDGPAIIKVLRAEADRLEAQAEADAAKAKHPESGKGCCIACGGCHPEACAKVRQRYDELKAMENKLRIALLHIHNGFGTFSNKDTSPMARIYRIAKFALEYRPPKGGDKHD